MPGQLSWTLTPSADTSTLRGESLVGPLGCRRSWDARVMVAGVLVGLSLQAFVLQQTPGLSPAPDPAAHPAPCQELSP